MARFSGAVCVDRGSLLHSFLEDKAAVLIELARFVLRKDAMLFVSFTQPTVEQRVPELR